MEKAVDAGKLQWNDLGTKLGEAEERAVWLTKQLGETEGETQNLKDNLKHEKQQLADLTGEHESLLSKALKLEQDLAEARGGQRELEERLKVAETTHDVLATEVQTSAESQRERDDVKNQTIENLMAERDALQDFIRQLDDVQSMEESVAARQVAFLTVRVEESEREVSRLKGQVTALTDEMAQSSHDLVEPTAEDPPGAEPLEPSN